MSKNKGLIITFHNPNNETDSQLIAEDFISHVSQSVLKEYLLKQGENSGIKKARCEEDVFENKDVVFSNS